jgi:hypothetical protein
MSYFSATGTATSVAATASSVSGVFTLPSGSNAIHIANTSASLYVSVALAASAASATLGGGLTLPPLGHIVVHANPTVASVAAIGSGAGPTPVVFTPGRVG